MKRSQFAMRTSVLVFCVALCSLSARAGTILDVLRGNDAAAQRKVIAEIAAAQDKGAIPELVSLAARDKADPVVRTEAFKALAKFADTRAADAALKVMNTEGADARVREAAAECAAAAGGDVTLAALKAILQGQQAGSKRHAAEAAGRMGAENAVPALVEAFSDKDPQVRASVVQALGRLGGEPAASTLRRALASDGDPRVRWLAAARLGELGDKGAVAVLIKALEDKDPEVRTSSIDSLGRLGNASAVRPIIRRLRTDDYPTARRTAVGALALLKGPGAVPALIAALSDSDIAFKIPDVLGDLTGEDFEDDQAKWKKWYADKEGKSVDEMLVAMLPGEDGKLPPEPEPAPEAVPGEGPPDREPGAEAAPEKVPGEAAPPAVPTPPVEPEVTPPPPVPPVPPPPKKEPDEDIDYAALDKKVFGAETKEPQAPTGVAVPKKPEPEPKELTPEEKEALLEQELGIRKVDWDRLRAEAPEVDEEVLQRKKELAAHIVALTSPDPAVQQEALRALTALRDRRSALPLINYLRARTDDEVLAVARKMAVDLLGELGDQRAVDVLTRIFNDQDENVLVRQAAVIALGKVSGAVFDQLVLALAKEPRVVVRQGIIEAMTRMRDKRAIEPLISILDDQDVCYGAQEALRELSGGKDYGLDQNRWRKWWEKTARKIFRKELAAIKKEVRQRGREWTKKQEMEYIRKLLALREEALRAPSPAERPAQPGRPAGELIVVAPGVTIIDEGQPGKAEPPLRPGEEEVPPEPAETPRVTFGLVAEDGSPARKHFNQAIEYFNDGKYAHAAKEFEEVIKLAPDPGDCLKMRDEASYQFFIRVLWEGDEELRQAARKFLQVAEEGHKAQVKDPERIKKLVDDLSKGFIPRWIAIPELVTAGEYAAPYLVPYLGATKDRNMRAYATIALTKCGKKAVAPLVEVLNAEDELLKQNVAMILGKIRDKRAMPDLLRVAQNDTESEAVKMYAREALAAITGRSSDKLGAAPDWYYLRASSFYYGAPGVIRPAHEDHVVWEWSHEDRVLAMKTVPRYAYYYEMAEEACYDALEADPSYDPVVPILLSSYYSQYNDVHALLKTALKGLPEGLVTEEEVAELRDRSDRLSQVPLIGYSIGERYLHSALDRALYDRKIGVALSCISALREVGTGTSLPPPDASIEIKFDREPGAWPKPAVFLESRGYRAPFTPVKEVAARPGETAAEERSAAAVPRKPVRQVGMAEWTDQRIGHRMASQTRPGDKVTLLERPAQAYKWVSKTVRTGSSSVASFGKDVLSSPTTQVVGYLSWLRDQIRGQREKTVKKRQEEAKIERVGRSRMADFLVWFREERREVKEKEAQAREAAIAEHGDAAALVRALGDPSKEVRYAAAEALTRIPVRQPFEGMDRVIPLLAQALGESGTKVVLVIANDLQVINHVGAMLKGLQFRAMSAGTGEKGIDEARDLPLKDLIVLDTRLADENVLTILDNLRHDYRTQNIPIILLVDEAEMDAARKTYGELAQGFLAKPVDEASLELRVREVLEESLSDELIALAARTSRMAAAALRDLDKARTVYSLEPAIPALLGALEVTRDEVRIPVVQVLGEIGAQEAGSYLVNVYRERKTSRDCRLECLRALGKLYVATDAPGEDVTALLDLALVSDDPEFREVAARALGRKVSPAPELSVTFERQRSKRTKTRPVVEAPKGREGAGEAEGGGAAPGGGEAKDDEEEIGL